MEDIVRYQKIEMTDEDRLEEAMFQDTIYLEDLYSEDFIRDEVTNGPYSNLRKILLSQIDGSENQRIPVIIELNRFLYNYNYGDLGQKLATVTERAERVVVDFYNQ